MNTRIDVCIIHVFCVGGWTVHTHKHTLEEIYMGFRQYPCLLTFICVSVMRVRQTDRQIDK